MKHAALSHVSQAPAPALSGNAPIDINREEAVDFWVSEWGCSEFELRVAVAQVGPAPADVGAALGRSV